MKSLDQVQREIGEWTAEQFGRNHSKDTESSLAGIPLDSLPPLLGMVEEVGELCHVTVYRHQGRGFPDPAEARAAKQDALADLLVFACDYGNRESFDLLTVLNLVWEKVSKRRQASWTQDKAEEVDLLRLPPEGVLSMPGSIAPETKLHIEKAKMNPCMPDWVTDPTQDGVHNSMELEDYKKPPKQSYPQTQESIRKQTLDKVNQLLELERQRHVGQGTYPQGVGVYSELQARIKDLQAQEEPVQTRQERVQTGQGWAEPPVEEPEDPAWTQERQELDQGVQRKFTARFKSIEEFRKAGYIVGNSYDRICKVCERVAVHVTNSLGICPDCYDQERRNA